MFKVISSATYEKLCDNLCGKNTYYRDDNLSDSARHSWEKSQKINETRK